jgi:hypothetical protein
MNIGSIESTLVGMSSASGSLDISVLKAVQNLAATQSALLFQAIGLGQGVDTFA